MKKTITSILFIILFISSFSIYAETADGEKPADFINDNSVVATPVPTSTTLYILEATAEPTVTVKPAVPTATPVPPTMEPVKPTATPVEPTKAPIKPTATPVEPTKAPVKPTATPVEVKAAKQVAITTEQGVVLDTSSIEKGLIRVAYNSPNEKRIKLMIMKDDKSYYYTLEAKGIYESFPLQLGNGEYKIYVLENIEGTKYQYISAEAIDVELENQNSVYLNSIQNVDWDNSYAAIAKAKELTEGLVSENEKVKAIYKYIISNIEYNYEKIKSLKPGYSPDIDSTIKDGNGICYDYASLFAGMLRSIDIPTKLVKGYKVGSKVYHAWNEVYLESQGKWLSVDTTTDATSETKRKEGMYKDSNNYNKVNEY